MSIDPPQSESESREGDSPKSAEAVGASGYPPFDAALATKTQVGAPSQTPTRIGQFHIKSVIASGGMGTVYEAVQEHPRRTVAVKVLKRGIASSSAMRRFEYESQTLARLRHPGIAQVYEAGTYDDGTGVVPYFAMEYIPHALPITNYAQERALTTRQKLELFARVCDAVHHGHQKGIIHRDLKPGNILVDSHGEVKVIDFGVARGTDSDLAVTTLQTDIGQLIGTLQYMSPEQCVADPHDIDIRSDVYALGVVLYEMLAGRPPYDVSKKAVLESTRMIREEQPTRLSTVDVTLKGDTETIVFKALEKDRERRYQSALDLAQDVRRYLAGEAIIARPPSIVYQLRVFARRNKAFFSAVAAAFVVLIAGVIVSTSLYVRAEKARKLAVLAEQEQTRERDRADLARTEAEGERDRALKAEAVARRQAFLANIRGAGTALSANEIGSVRRNLDAVPPELRNWEWRYLDAQSNDSLAVHQGGQERTSAIAFSPDAARVASGSDDGMVRIWDVSTGQALTVLRGHEDWVACVAFSPDGSKLASASGDKTVRLWDTSTGEQLATLKGHRRWVRSVAFNPNGTRLASASADNTVRLWDTSTHEATGLLEGYGSGVNSIAFSPDGTHLALASTDSSVRVWKTSTGRQLAVLWGHERRVHSVVFSPDGKRLVSGSADNTVRLWDASAGEELAVFRGHEHTVSSVAFDPDGARLASASYDKTIRVWDPATGKGIAVLRGHKDNVWSVAFTPDGTRLVSASDDMTIHLWDVGGRERLAVFKPADSFPLSVAFSPDGTRVASGSGWGWSDTPVDNAVRLRDPATGEELAVLVGHEEAVRSIVFNPDGTRLASGSEDKTVRLWDASTGEELAVLRGHESYVLSVAFSPDGTRLASASYDKTLCIWDTATRKALAILRGHEDWVACVAFSPDGSKLASASGDKTVRLWDTSTGEQLAILEGHRGGVRSVAFSPNGTRLASASADETIRVWDVNTGEELAVLPGHGGPVTSVAFSPDGTRLASASGDATVRLWDASTGEQLCVLRDHEDGALTVAFSPDGTSLASTSRDRTLHIWHTEPYLVRYQRRQRILAARPEAERVVEDLWQQPADCRAIAKQLGEDASLTRPQRRAALNILLKKSAQLQQQVDTLYARLVFADDVLAALEADDSLVAGVRYRAVNAARAKGDDAMRLNASSWHVVRSAGRDHEAYTIGLRGAEAAVAAVPDDVDFLNTLGMAQYRNRHFESAFATLTRCAELRRQRGLKSVPRDVAALSMTLFRLGRIEEARAAFERLEDIMSDPAEEWYWYREASALLAECKQLLEGLDAPADPLEIVEEDEDQSREP